MGDKGGNSIALNDHKAFLFSKEKNLLVIPVSVQQEDILEIQGSIIKKLDEKMEIMPPMKNKYFNGAMVFYVDKKGFMLKGKVDHSDSDNNYGYSPDSVKRSLYIENILYTLSNKYLKMNGLSDIEEVNSLELGSGAKIMPVSESMPVIRDF